jgi:hypothetical protein
VLVDHVRAPDAIAVNELGGITRCRERFVHERGRVRGERRVGARHVDAPAARAGRRVANHDVAPGLDQRARHAMLAQRA